MHSASPFRTHPLLSPASRAIPAIAALRKQGPGRLALFSRPGALCLLIFISLASALFGVASPWYQKTFVDSLAGAPTAPTASKALLAAFIAMLCAGVGNALGRILCARESGIAQQRLSEALYRHTLALSGRARLEKSVGEIVSYYAQDVAAVGGLLEEFLPSFLTSVLPFIVAPVAVSLLFDFPMDGVWIALLLSTGVTFLLGLRQSAFFTRFKRLAAERIGIVNEWLTHIRVIRSLGWVERFERAIFTKREEETDNRIRMVSNGSFLNAIAQVAPLAINLAGVASLVRAQGDALSPGGIFALLWVFGVFLTRPLRMLPWTLVTFLDGWNSSKRLQAFFLLEAEPEALLRAPDAAAVAAGNTPEALSLEIEGLDLRGGAGEELLRDLSFSISAGEFVAIVGEVGAGKSLLLSSLLRDTPATFRRYLIGGRDACRLPLPELRSLFAVVPQDGFVMSASLRDNVRFEYQTDSVSDADVLESLRLAHFHLETERVGSGLDAEIGERGVNLSGGQRQRVSLARAHHADRPVLILDDCLSAVDVLTEQAILGELFGGAWASRTRILVTHRMSVLRHVDRVLVMREGKIVEEGKPLLLLQRQSVLRELLEESELAAAAWRGTPADPEGSA